MQTSFVSKVVQSPSQWLTANEAATYLKVSPRTLLMWARRGKVKAYVLSGTERQGDVSGNRTWMLCCRRRPLLELEDSSATEQRWKRSFRQTNESMDILLLGPRQAAF